MKVRADSVRPSKIGNRYKVLVNCISDDVPPIYVSTIIWVTNANDIPVIGDYFNAEQEPTGLEIQKEDWFTFE